MPYSERDVAGFTQVPTYKQVLFGDLVNAYAPSRVVPVTYAFGGVAPDAIELSDGSRIFAGTVHDAARVFVEYTAYYWNPDSPDWNGQ